MRKILIAILVLMLSITAFLLYRYLTKLKPTNPAAQGWVTTYAGTGAPGSDDGARGAASFTDPFGVAVDKRGNVIVSDGATNRLRLITPQGEVKTIAGSNEGYSDGPAAEAQFNTPSGISFDRDGNLIIADMSNNRIRKLSADYKTVSTIAGSGAQGFKDGAALEAQFDGPVGVAVDRQGNLYVADAYNDRIRKIAPDGSVTTLAGAGTPGLRDGDAAEAMFDTPCGVAVDPQGNVFVADTANRAVRRIASNGEVLTVKATPQYSGDAGVDLARLEHPMGLTLTHDGFLFIADAGSHRVVRIAPDADAALYARSLASRAIDQSLDSPSGIAVDHEGNLFVTDPHNYLVKKIAPITQAPPGDAENTSPELFIQPPVEPIGTKPGEIIPKLDASVLNITQPFPWPVNPQNQWHEVAGTVGEARGNFNGTALDHLHAGLDVRGVMGEPCLSVYDEKVTDPLPNWGFEQTGEGVHVGAFTYIHIRVGRDGGGQLQSPEKFKARLDGAGKLVGVRVRRGARFRVGDLLGTLNRLYHVHLNFGPWNAIANPIQLPFTGFKDTVAPVIEPGGIEVVKAGATADQAGEPFKEKRDGRLVVSGDVKILVAAYDRVDGNVASRKLGLYRVGYQLLRGDGSPVPGFEQPLINLEFNRLPPSDEDVNVVYAAGSGVSAYGTPTKFKYIVTNRVRDAEARPGLLRTSQLAPGNYQIRILAEDYAGNRASGTTTELSIEVTGDKGRLTSDR